MSMDFLKTVKQPKKMLLIHSKIEDSSRMNTPKTKQDDK